MIHQLTVGELATNCWIVPLDDSLCILVDPGGSAKSILARLKSLMLRPRYIVLTHSHFDHIAALPEIASEFPEAEIAIHREEGLRLGPRALEYHRRDFAVAGAAEYVDTHWKPMPPAGILLDEDDTIGPFTILHLPGHSPGSIGLYRKDEKTLISGDTLFHAGVGRTDLPGGSWEELEQSLKRLFRMEDAEVYPGHGQKTSLSREKKRLGF
jgi:glyoxylase-like metal-dependent hydrolase (beta-lactamase superfamily II)